MKTDFSKLFDTVKWGGKLDNNEASMLYRTLSDLSSCDDNEDFANNYSTAILVYGLTTSGANNNIAFVEKFLNENLFCDTIRGAALKVLCQDNYYGHSLKYQDLLIEQVNNINEDNVSSDMLYTSIISLGECAFKNNSIKALTCLYDNFCKIVAVPRRENELYDILEVLYNALQYAIWGNDYSVKERYITFSKLRFPEDANPKLIEIVKSKIKEGDKQ